ncbi:PHP domain-containing protein [Halothermothrix orenii]|uniref:PHP domain protein n=1 Tax=Halothermothrix orenii (strain H 168 / OCM 544 / DSM 9562) TaxID=373903 RepID=B8CYH0_HALOH|nr:PHP domain-containing protein [Halothermothrix orenii]ACL70339.1 PHP domain protein [Halothermothrix orenii H 168]
MRFIGDYHTHSQYSHGKGDLRENVEEGILKGLQEIGIADHGPRSFSIIPLGVKKAETLLEIKKEVDRLQGEYPGIKILCGVEANIINGEGELDVPHEVLKELDFVAAGLHLLILPPDLKTARYLIWDNRISYKCFPSRQEEIRSWNTRAVVNAVKRYNIDFITHPGYGVDIDTCELGQVCAGEGTLLEINTRHSRLEGFIRAASQTEVKFIVNSDAHSPREVGELDRGLKLIKEVGISPERVINLV